MPPLRKKKWIRVIGITVAALLLIALIIQVTGSAFVKPFLARQLQQAVFNGSDSLYRLNYTGVGVNLWTGSVTLTGVKFSVDSARFRYLRSVDRLPSLTVRLRAEKMRMRRFNVLRFLLSRDMHIAHISTEDADIGLYRHAPQLLSESQTPEPVWKLIRPGIRGIFVKTFRLDNIRLSYYNAESGKALAWRFDRFDMHISDIRVDSASALDDKRLLCANDIEVNVRRLRWHSPDSLYRLTVERFSYSLQKGVLQADSLVLEPVCGRQEFYRRTGMEKDIYTVRMPMLRLVNFRPELFASHNCLQADSLLLYNGEVTIYHDRMLPDDTASKLGKYPHQLLLKSPLGISVRYARVHNLRVSYTEKSDLTRQEGRLSFTGIDGSAANISNRAHDIRRNGACEVWVKGRFMKETGISGKFIFDLTRTDGSFSAEAHMTPTDVTVLNPVTEALGSARFKSLKTGPVYYRVHGNEYGAYGYLEMPYTDLHMQILHLPENGKDPRHKRFMTWMVKNFSFNENPRRNEPLRIAGNVYHKRHIHRSFFNLLWKTLYSCAKDVATKDVAKVYLQKRKNRAAKKK